MPVFPIDDLEMSAQLQQDKRTVLHFLSQEQTKHMSYWRPEDFPSSVLRGEVIRVTVEYITEGEVE